MKITNILLWAAGITGVALLARKMMKPKVNPETGEGVPGRTVGSGVRDKKTNFIGKTTTRRHDPFDGNEEGLNEGDNNLEGFDLMTGKRMFSKVKKRRTKHLPPAGFKKWVEGDINLTSGGCEAGEKEVRNLEGYDSHGNPIYSFSCWKLVE